VLVVGLWRRDGWLAEELSKLPLLGGDVLVLTGSAAALARASAACLSVSFKTGSLRKQPCWRP